MGSVAQGPAPRRYILPGCYRVGPFPFGQSCDGGNDAAHNVLGISWPFLYSGVQFVCFAPHRWRISSRWPKHIRVAPQVELDIGSYNLGSVCCLHRGHLWWTAVAFRVLSVLVGIDEPI